MFMFRQRRHALVKRLWKLRKGPPESSPDLESGNGFKKEEEEEALERRKYAAAHSMLKRLKESQLEDLVTML
jgi:hypothetical protein